MRSIDTSSSLRIAVLMEMLEDVSRAKDAEAAFRAFARRIRRVRPIDAYARISTHGLGPGEFRVLRTHRAKGGEFETIAPAPREVARLPIQTGGFIGSVVKRREPQLYQEMQLAGDPILGDVAAGMGSCMCVPMFEGGRIDGWSLMFRSDPRGYAIEDLEDDLLIGNLFGAITLNMSSVERISELNAQLREQFDQVARVQKALLPSDPPHIPGVRFAASYLPSDQAGGDYYDFFDLGDGRIGVLIADVSGHGPAAATIMAMLHAMLHARPDVCASPAGALKFANASLAASSIEGTHVTAAFVLLDTAARTLSLARAGHPLPRVRGSGGLVRAIGGGAGEGAAPMGIVADGYEPRESVVPVAPGDTIVLYTDGISEAENPAGEQLGMPGLDRAIAGAPDDPAAIIASVQAAVTAHTGSPIRGDDQTLVVFRVEP
jgi:phosphoserine phosphatase RsbU/P